VQAFRLAEVVIFNVAMHDASREHSRDASRAAHEIFVDEIMCVGLFEIKMFVSFGINFFRDRV
jgi:hypothetical protein